MKEDVVARSFAGSLLQASTPRRQQVSDRGRDCQTAEGGRLVPEADIAPSARSPPKQFQGAANKGSTQTTWMPRRGGS